MGKQKALQNGKCLIVKEFGKFLPIPFGGTAGTAERSPEIPLETKQVSFKGNSKVFIWALTLMLGLWGFGSNISAQDAEVDFDGDGMTDYSIVRDETSSLRSGQTLRARRSVQEMNSDPGFKSLPLARRENLGTGPGTDIGFYIRNSQTGTVRIEAFGNPATDFWVPEDYDGDGQDDIAVWQPVGLSGPGGAFFYSFNSSTNTTSVVDFGQQGDNPTVVGDYDGDGMADPAVYRCPPDGGQCSFFFQGSAGGGEITSFVWGNNSLTESRPYPGDFDGDGKNDFCVFNNGIYFLSRSTDGGIEFIDWGDGTEAVLAPGDYDGDGSTDFMNVRVNGSQVEWWLMERDGPTSITPWGAFIPGFSEFITQGDFDGDGSTDIAIWRRDSADPANSFFYVLRSTDGVLQTFSWGSTQDAPIPGWNGN